MVARHAEPNAWDPQARRAAASLLVLDEFRLFPAAISRALVADALARSGISHSDQVLSRYPVLKIHHTAAKQRSRKAVVMQRLTPTLTSELP